PVLVFEMLDRLEDRREQRPLALQHPLGVEQVELRLDLVQLPLRGIQDAGETPEIVPFVRLREAGEQVADQSPARVLQDRPEIAALVQVGLVAADIDLPSSEGALELARSFRGGKIY